MQKKTPPRMETRRCSKHELVEITYQSAIKEETKREDMNKKYRECVKRILKFGRKRVKE